jgi:hypothetical protein
MIMTQLIFADNEALKLIGQFEQDPHADMAIYWLVVTAPPRELSKVIQCVG